MENVFYPNKFTNLQMSINTVSTLGENFLNFRQVVTSNSDMSFILIIFYPFNTNAKLQIYKGIQFNTIATLTKISKTQQDII